VGNKFKAIFAVASFRDASAQFFKPRLCVFLTLVSWPILYQHVYQFRIAWNSFARVSNFLVFSPLMFFWPLVVLKLWLTCRKSSKKWILGSIWKETAFLIDEV